MSEEKDAPKPVEWTAQRFAEHYNKLVAESGFALAPTIETIPTNHGTFELAAKLVVQPVKK